MLVMLRSAFVFPSLIRIKRMVVTICLIFTLLDLINFTDAAVGWLALAGVAIDQSAKGYTKHHCKSLQGLSKRQIQICRRNVQQMQSVQLGAYMALRECEYQFRHRRWNCTMTTSENLFGPTSQLAGTREIGFLHAIASAGVAHSVTRACSAGHIDKCGCDLSLRGPSGRGFTWGGCSDNIHYSILFSKKFVDAHERRKKQPKDHYLMNLHNNEAGRKVLALERNMRIMCRCHGVSGSCEMRTCWKKMPTMRAVGSILKDKFDGATQVRFVSDNSRLSLTPVFPEFKHQTEEDLVYLNRSPNFCVGNDTIGSLGTSGRTCNVSSRGIDGCELLCCDRGYRAREEVRQERCDCKFHWCCYVKCTPCTRTVSVHTCI